MKLKLLKLKTKTLTFLGNCIGYFNTKVKGVQANYNCHYGKDKKQTLDILYPTKQQNLPCVVYIHGGGWSCYDKSLFRSTCKTIASKGAVVFNCNYRFAPKHTISDMLVDVMLAVKYAVSHAKLFGGDTSKIILAGDSSGAHLVTLFNNLLNYINHNEEKSYTDNPIATTFVSQCKQLFDNTVCLQNSIAGLILFYGAYNLDNVEESGFKHIKTFIKGVIPANTTDRQGYLQSISPTTYLYKNNQPTLLFSGEIDKLHNSQSLCYYHQLQENGSNVTAHFFDKKNKKAQHKFITFHKNPISQRAFGVIEEFVQQLNDI